MNKTSFAITAAVFAAIVAGVWLYQNLQKEKASPWRFIDNQAALVFEASDAKSFDKINSVLNRMGANASLRRIADIITEANIVTGKKILLSVHAISADDFALSLFFEARDVNSLSKFDAFMTEKMRCKADERMYNGFPIKEYSKGKGQILGATQIEDIFLISTTSILIERSIRLYDADNAELFSISNSNMFKLPSLQSDEGNLYINTSELNKSIRQVAETGLSGWTIDQLGNAALLDVKIDSNKILLNGFLTDGNGSKEGFLSLFQDQRPVQFGLSDFISNRTAYLVGYSLSDPEAWMKAQSHLFSKSSQLNQQRDELLKKYSINEKEVTGKLGKHVATCYLNFAGKLESLSVIEFEKSPSEALNKISEVIAEVKGDTVYVESYSDLSIRLIDAENFFRYLFYPLIPSSSQSYYVVSGNHILTSENIDLVKYFLEDIEQENTWGKSVIWNRYIESTLQESNINLFFDGPLTGLAAGSSLNKKWKAFVDTTQFAGLTKGSVQVSHLDALFYVNSVLQFNAGSTSSKGDYFRTFEFGKGLSVGPQLVKNHDNKEFEVVLQDSSGSIQLFSKELKRQWAVNLDEKISSSISQIDFYANNKLQMLFFTPSRLHLIDRLGREVDGFPVALPKVSFDFISVVDYDKSKKYRYLLADSRGNLFLVDKSGAMLDGWKPRPTAGILQSAPNHYRVFGRDYFIAVQKNGVVNMINRRGESIKGFPVSTNIRPGGDYFLQRGRDSKSTFFVLISEDGQRLQIDFEGNVTRTDVLQRPTTTSRFELVRSADQETFVVFRVDATRLAVLDHTGKLMFETQNTGSDQWVMKFVLTDLNRKIFCLHDPQQNFSYFIDESGKVLFSRPLNSDWAPTFYFDASTRSVKVFNVYGTALSTFDVKLE